MSKEELFNNKINNDDFEIIDNNKDNISPVRKPPRTQRKDEIVAEDDEYEYLYDDPEQEYDDDEYELVYVDENGNVLEVVNDAEIVSEPNLVDPYENKEIYENEGFDADDIKIDLSMLDDISNSSPNINLDNVQNSKIQKPIDNFNNKTLCNNKSNNELKEKNIADKKQFENTPLQSNTKKSKSKKVSVETKINIVGYLTIVTVLVTLTIIIYAVLSGENSIIKNKSSKDNTDISKSDSKDNTDNNSLDNTDKSKDEDGVNYETTVNKDYFSLVFGGDVLLSDSLISTYGENNPNINNIFRQNILDEFLEADVAMVNEEFPFSTRGVEMSNKKFTFRTNPKYISVFTDMGLDIVSLANNHILDYGIDALSDTLTTLKAANIQYVGAGENIEEAETTRYFQKNGIDTAVLCASRVIPVANWNATNVKPGVFTTYNPDSLIEKIKEAENEVDFTIVYVHWGVENSEYPELYQKNLAFQYIDAGADLVIGCHTHCLQGMEYYKGKPIVYSMGNFMFGNEIDKTMALKVNIHKDNNVEVQVIPCKSKSYCTYKVENTGELNDFFNYYSGISYGVKFDENGFVKK